MMILAGLLSRPTHVVAQIDASATLQTGRSSTSECVSVQDSSNPGGNGGSLIGCINPTTGAFELPSNLRNQGDIDERVLRSYGFRGDGESHPLSSITTLNGRNTAGWSLVQWQVILPAARALSDEIDGVVINTLIQTKTSALKFRLGPLTARFSTPIISACGQSIRFEGAGPELTVFRFGASNGWDHCRTGPPKGDKLELHGIKFQSSDTASTSTIGINARFTPRVNGTYSNFALENFNTGMVLVNSAGTMIEGGMITAGPSRKGLANTGTGIWFRGTNTFVNRIQNTLTQYYRIGYRFQSTNPPKMLGLEDQSLINSAAGEVGTCIQIDSDYKGYSPLQYVADNFSCDAYEGHVDARQVSHLSIKGGNWLIHPATGSWTPAGKNFFNFCRASTVRLEGAWISNNAQPLEVRSLINVTAASCGIPNGAGASDVQIRNNKIEYRGLKTSTALIVKDPSTSGVVVAGNLFTEFFKPGPPPPNAFSWAGSDAQSALYQGLAGELVQTSPPSVDMTNGAVRDIGTFSLAPGVWSCHAQLQLLPAGGAKVRTFQGAFSTQSTAMPVAPGQGMFMETGEWSGGEIRGIGPFVFDFTTKTQSSAVHIVGAASFAGGQLQMNTVGQCVRLR
ncbi:hypothetical protein RNI52_16350 [Labrys neptuniae]|uniref:Right-handed parallel beta-helix repeat-containing protein n=1 Tax=Labrys neptuniae TaxID=376174 RepID=A0ABV3PEG1_9HYPH|nr:hypothetical protein [Labrys neptuniae]MDT3378905.1 hypothetical protein [Labrys neptuniae]